MWKRGAGDSWALDGSLMAGIWSENEVSCRHAVSSHRLVRQKKLRVWNLILPMNGTQGISRKLKPCCRRVETGIRFGVDMELDPCN
jgi:hypothetical protein